MSQLDCDDRTYSEETKGYRRLIAAILLDAVTHYCQHPDHSDGRAAQEWIFSNDRHVWVLSFLTCCEHLGVDPEYARKEIQIQQSLQNVYDQYGY